MKTNLKVLGQTKQVSLMGDIISSYNTLFLSVSSYYWWWYTHTDSHTHKNITKQYNSNKKNNNGVCILVCYAIRATESLLLMMTRECEQKKNNKIMKWYFKVVKKEI